MANPVNDQGHFLSQKNRGFEDRVAQFVNSTNIGDALGDGEHVIGRVFEVSFHGVVMVAVNSDNRQLDFFGSW